LGKAVQIALNQVVGAYAIAVFLIKKKEKIVAARLGSPLAIGMERRIFLLLMLLPLLSILQMRFI
jgi:glucosamine--fructose-6-phosphate aminotransferase (isomerizing)